MHEQEDSAPFSGTRPRLNSDVRSSHSCRRSARLQAIESGKCVEKDKEPYKLPSPSLSQANSRRGGNKRKHAASGRLLGEDTLQQQSKRRKLSPSPTERPETAFDNRISYWVETNCWPRIHEQHRFNMSEAPSSKRRSSSSHSHRSQALRRLAVHGVLIKSSNLLQKESRALCNAYLRGSRQVVRSSIFNAEEFEMVLVRVQDLNEARIQRDVTPWIVPSAETLFIRGDFHLDWVGEELNAEWIRCATMGSTKPKPDYAAGLLRSAFTEEEIMKLENFASPTQPFHFTPNLCFPFLMCEAKTGERGMNEADRQNIHSASIAVRAIIRLYQEAYGKSADCVHELYGQVLVFTVSHDNDRVLLYGHYAVAEPGLPDGFKFHRHAIALYSLSITEGADRLKAYNFVRNVYDKFAPAHRRRIQDAVAHLPSPPTRTGLSFVASEFSLDQADSQQNSRDDLSQQDEQFKRPGEPASTTQGRELAKMRAQMEQQSQDSREQIEQQRQQMEQQLQQQRQDSKEQMEQQRQQMEQQLQQQRQDSKEQMEQQLQQMVQQFQQQRQDSKEQMERQLQQQSEIISILKCSGKS